MTKQSRALVLFSGGQDSATCLAWALDRYDYVETVGFDYGQRHRIELTARNQVRDALVKAFPEWAIHLGPDHMLDATVLGALGDTALTHDAEIRMGEDGLPNTFVPGRNLLFLVLAGALGYRRDIDVLVGGMCETDYSGYPDCRDATMAAMEGALGAGMARPTEIKTPLMFLTKAQTWALAHDLGGMMLVDLIREESHTCYNGVRDELQEWGYGCGTCPACELRAKGFREWVDAV